MGLRAISVALCALCALGAMTGASAASYGFLMPLVPAVPYVSSSAAVGPSDFTDYWNFTAPATAKLVSASIISADLLPNFDLSSLRLTLFTGLNGAGSILATGPVGESSELQGISITAGADYSFRVTGQAGLGSGFYVFQAAASPIPEPRTAALMLAGLVCIALWVARRRVQG